MELGETSSVYCPDHAVRQKFIGLMTNPHALHVSLFMIFTWLAPVSAGRLRLQGRI
jgi:hypothetical protein